ncbi:hypothetical protein MOQ_002418 [Trypanosoma cruzi marinkellei]|uniref:Uncharacterized protein n=1 Tax=Trypanosoma cruzi marinkellei TaxID=85056 RepID=K2NG01_TRYCR|nr:hypothetical protein MOQ_002418 [Trypanosoma cruzi marinkellei]
MDLLDELFPSPPVSVPSGSHLVCSVPVRDDAAAAICLPADDLNAAPVLRHSIGESVGAGFNVCDLLSTAHYSERLEEVVLVLERIMNEDVPRWYEASVILRCLFCRSDCGKMPNPVASDGIGGDPPGSSIRNDGIVNTQPNLVSIFPFLEFLQTFKHVSVFPVLEVPRLAFKVRQCVQDWVESHGGVRAVLSDSHLALDLQTLLENVNEVFATMVETSPQSASEALLLSSLTDVCRYCIQLVCTCLPHGDHLFLATTMQSVMHHNSSVMSHLEGEIKTHEDILQLLVVARSTAYHRCSEDIQASVSPLVAELFSLLDIFSSSSMVPLDKKKVPERRCKLSGLRLHPSDTCEEIDVFVNRYWNVAIGSPIPSVEKPEKTVLI